MVNKLTEIIAFLRKAISTIDIKVYSISLAISSFIWLVMTMSDNYTERVGFNVSYSNFPKGLVLVNHPVSEISVDVKSQGFELASAALSDKKPVNIDLNEIKFRKTKYGRYVASVATKSFRYNISNQLNVDDVGKDFIPDSVFFIFDSLITKKLPIRFNSEFKYAEGFVEYGDPIIEPAVVEVSGPASDVRSLSYINTKKVVKEDVNIDYNDDISLLPQKLIEYNIKKVKVNQKVAKFSEFEVKRRIRLESNIPNLKVKFFPKVIDVVFSMPLPDYKIMNDTAFELVVKVDSLDILNKKKLLVNILRIPNNADNIRLSNESVEYVILD
ncbi:MAG: hypothetical protein B6I18_05635 [Bacteroidetes bacterium 4572_112]|nr:MAG: hypothetical protein B6I18_05635 [Bacteroidetes bacterium 4572_112]